MSVGLHNYDKHTVRNYHAFMMWKAVDKRLQIMCVGYGQTSKYAIVKRIIDTHFIQKNMFKVSSTRFRIKLYKHVSVLWGLQIGEAIDYVILTFEYLQ